MKTILRLIATLLLLVTPAFAQSLPSKEKVLADIETFSKAPLSPEGQAAGKEIMQFWSNPKSVDYARVSLFPEFHIVYNTNTPEVSKEVVFTFLRASVAGNLRPQLKDGVIGNRPYEGLQQVLQSYAQLKADGKCPSIAKFDKYADLEAKGQLKQYVDNIIKQKKNPAK